MPAATADQETPFKAGDVVSYDVAAGEQIFLGALVNLDSAGDAVAGTDSATDIGFAGVAIESVDNTGGAAGDVTVQVRRGGLHRYTADTSTLAETDVGTLVHVENDLSVALAADVTNNVVCGKIAKFISASEAWVDLLPVTEAQS